MQKRYDMQRGESDSSADFVTSDLISFVRDFSTDSRLFVYNISYCNASAYP